MSKGTPTRGFRCPDEDWDLFNSLTDNPSEIIRSLIANYMLYHGIKPVKLTPPPAGTY